MFVRESDVPQQLTAHGAEMPTRKRVLVGNGVIPHITQIATSVSYDECDSSVDPHHVHKTMWEIYFVRSGHAVFTIGGEVHHAGPGSFITVPPDTEHFYKVAAGETMELLYFGVATD
jgi:mannose-6-phosphate isomerase-like protein (cupin superfamily)